MNGLKSRLLTGLAVVWLLLPGFALAVDNDADKVIAESELPWFDAETRELVSGPMPKSTESRVGDRRSIPPYVASSKKKKKKKNAPAATGTTWGGAGFTQFVNAIVYIVAGIFLLALVGLLIWAFYRREDIWGPGGDSKVGKKKRRSMKDHIRHLPFEVEEQEGDFRTAAERAFAGGDYSRAVIYLYAELLVILDENDLVRLQRGRTNRQYLNAIRDHEPLAIHFQKVMTTFEDAFFGRHSISKERAEECFAVKPDFERQAQQIKAASFNAKQLPIPPLAEAGV